MDLKILAHLGLWALALIAITSAANPNIHIVYRSLDSDNIQVSHDVEFDTSFSEDQDDGDFIYISAVAYGPQCSEKPCVLQHNSTSTSFIANFHVAGEYRVIVTVSDKAWAQGITPLTKDNFAAPFAITQFTVHETRDCYFYDVMTSSDDVMANKPQRHQAIALRSTTTTLKVRVWDSADIGLAQSQSIARNLDYQGEKLLVSFSNDVVTLNAEPVFNESERLWEFSISISPVISKQFSSLKMTLQSRGTTLLGCSVASKIQTLSLNSWPLEYQQTNNLNMTVLASGEFLVRSHPCGLSTVIAFARNSSMNVVLSGSFFETANITNFQAQACTALVLDSSQCARLRLWDACFTETHLVLLTNHGILTSELPSSSETDIGTTLSFKRVASGIPNLDTGSLVLQDLSLYPKDSCEIRSARAAPVFSYLRLTYKEGNGYSTSVMYSNTTAVQKWYNAATRLVADIEPYESITKAVPCALPNQNSSVYVLGDSQTGRVSRIVLQDAEGQHNLSLPVKVKNASQVDIHPHRSSQGLLLTTSDSLFASVSQGHSLYEHRIGATIHSIATSAVTSSFAALIEPGIVMFGRIGVPEIIPCLHLNLRQMRVNGVGLGSVLAFDEQDQLWLISSTLTRVRLDVSRCIHSYWNHFKATSLTLRRHRISAFEFIPTASANASPYSNSPPGITDGSTLKQSTSLCLSWPCSVSTPVPQTRIFQTPYAHSNRLSNNRSWVSQDYHTLQPYTKALALKFTVEAIASSASSDDCFKLGDQVWVFLHNIGANEGWTADLKGMTVVLQKASFLLGDRVNASHIQASVVEFNDIFDGSSCQCLARPNAWKLYDFREFLDEASVGKQVLTLALLSQSVTMASISNGTFEFSSDHVGHVLWVHNGDGFGIVEKVFNASSAALTIGNLQLRQNSSMTMQVSSGQWSLYPLNVDFDYETLPNVQNAMTPWHVEPPKCRFRDILSSLRGEEKYIKDSLIEYVDRGTSANITTITPLDPETGLGEEDVIISILNSGISDISLASTQGKAPLQLGGYAFARFLNMRVGDTGQQGVVTIRMMPRQSSLLCYNSFVQNVLIGCPPSKQLIHVAKYSSRDLMNLGSSENELSSPVQTFPVNYRAPSKHGRAVPISRHIYNADPSQPKHNNMFEISQQTGELKACRGKKSRQDCGCTDDMKTSSLIKNSDCIDRAERVFYRRAYTPSLNIVETGREPTPLMSRYVIEEVNERTDFCVFRLNIGCITKGGSTTATMEPSMNDSISWSGDQLYHFRVRVIGGTYCELGTEFMVYVFRPPLQGPSESTIVSITAVVLALILFLIYLLYKKRVDPRYSPLRTEE